jgi:hypothetical protein
MDEHQKAFENIKKIICREVMLTFPDFSEPFHIYTDASDKQLGAVITQDEKPIACYSRKLNIDQQRYTTVERELLSIVETLREFRNILLGDKIWLGYTKGGRLLKKRKKVTGPFVSHTKNNANYIKNTDFGLPHDRIDNVLLFPTVLFKRLYSRQI